MALHSFAPWRASAKARAAPRCLTCLCLSVVCGCVGVWCGCGHVCVCVCVCVLCAPLSLWVLGASVGWLCVGWLALRHLLQGPSFWKGLEAQGRPASPRVCFCVVSVVVSDVLSCRLVPHRRKNGNLHHPCPAARAQALGYSGGDFFLRTPTAIR